MLLEIFFSFYIYSGITFISFYIYSNFSSFYVLLSPLFTRNCYFYCYSSPLFSILTTLVTLFTHVHSRFAEHTVFHAMFAIFLFNYSLYLSIKVGINNGSINCETFNYPCYSFHPRTPSFCRAYCVLCHLEYVVLMFAIFLFNYSVYLPIEVGINNGSINFETYLCGRGV